MSLKANQKFLQETVPVSSSILKFQAAPGIVTVMKSLVNVILVAPQVSLVFFLQSQRFVVFEI